MNGSVRGRVWSVVALAALGACGGEPASGGPPAAAAPSAEAKQLVLAADPGKALGIVAAKATPAGDAAAQVVVFGRIASSVPGHAVFTLMDTAIPYCGETNPEDHCKTPWDYCCESPTTRASNSLLVEARGADGKPLATPSLPDLQLLDAVKVVGKLATDDHGNQVLIATGVFRTERPKLPGDLRWPQ